MDPRPPSAASLPPRTDSSRLTANTPSPHRKRCTFHRTKWCTFTCTPTRISTATDACAPKLLELYGVGPDTAAALLTAAGDNPDRLASEASFAALCGASPVEASSGKTQRRRLNRGGDRQANSALYTIVIARLRWDTRTRSYVERRVTEGTTTRSHPMPQTLRGPRDLPSPAHSQKAIPGTSPRRLTSIGAPNAPSPYQAALHLAAILIWARR
ncbi:transposase [Streptomyces sviceus]|uniref:transposase n=1 Tax=Streptomyces sviceus TaxID=285530 RepID=UPI0036E97B3F